MLQSLGDLLARSAAHSRIVLELWDEERREVEIAVSRGAEAIAKQRFGFDESPPRPGRRSPPAQAGHRLRRDDDPRPHERLHQGARLRLLLAVPSSTASGWSVSSWSMSPASGALRLPGDAADRGHRRAGRRGHRERPPLRGRARRPRSRVAARRASLRTQRRGRLGVIVAERPHGRRERRGRRSTGCSTRPGPGAPRERRPPRPRGRGRRRTAPGFLDKLGPIATDSDVETAVCFRTGQPRLGENIDALAVSAAAGGTPATPACAPTPCCPCSPAARRSHLLRRLGAAATLRRRGALVPAGGRGPGGHRTRECTLYEAARLAQEQVRHELDAPLLQKVTTAATSSLSLPEIGARVLAIGTQALAASSGAIFVVDEAHEALRAIALAGYPDDTAARSPSCPSRSRRA